MVHLDEQPLLEAVSEWLTRAVFGPGRLDYGGRRWSRPLLRGRRRRPGTRSGRPLTVDYVVHPEFGGHVPRVPSARARQEWQLGLRLPVSWESGPVSGPLLTCVHQVAAPHQIRGLTFDRAPANKRLPPRSRFRLTENATIVSGVRRTSGAAGSR